MKEIDRRILQKELMLEGLLRLLPLGELTLALDLTFLP